VAPEDGRRVAAVEGHWRREVALGNLPLRTSAVADLDLLETYWDFFLSVALANVVME